MTTIHVDKYEIELIKELIKKYRYHKEYNSLLLKVLSSEAMTKNELISLEDCIRNYKSTTLFIRIEKLENGKDQHTACEELLQRVIKEWQSLNVYS